MQDGEAVAFRAAADRHDLDRTTSEAAALDTATIHNSPPSTSSATAPRSHAWLSALRKPETTSGPRLSRLKTRPYLTDDDVRRDSALAPSTSTGGRGSLVETHETEPELRKVSSSQSIVPQDEPGARPVEAKKVGFQGPATPKPPAEETSHSVPVHPFTGIDTEIPRGSFDDCISLGRLEFSARGSILLVGKKADMAVRRAGTINRRVTSSGVRRSQDTVSSRRDLSTDEMRLSQKVRALYEYGGENTGDGISRSGITSTTASIGSTIEEEDSSSDVGYEEQPLTVGKVRQRGADGIRSASRMTAIRKEPFEIAGGVEDWENIHGGEVDRYGFIIPKKPASRNSSNNSAVHPERPQFQRVSTSLRVISEAPRRNRTIRSPGPAVANNTPNRNSSSQYSIGSPASIRSYQSMNSHDTTHNPFRYAANRLPHNRERRWMDEASDMLTLPPGLADIAEQHDGGRVALEAKRREWVREEKWRKMGRVTSRQGKGGGMVFEFDTKDRKLISRTWKGIPDRWRATAWHAFLSASARRNKDSATDEELTESFHALQDESSADDVQIDVDIPRTINNHIMFRRRYRGG